MMCLRIQFNNNNELENKIDEDKVDEWIEKNILTELEKMAMVGNTFIKVV